MKHNYQFLDGWFNMEVQYSYLLESTPDGGIFVELGSWKGKSTSYIVTEMINNNRDVKFFTVDTFEGVLDGTDSSENIAYTAYNLDEIYDIFQENTRHLKDYFTVIRSESDKAASQFKDESVDVIFIDAGHSYEAVKADLKAWYPKMKKNSIMAGHDFHNWPGVNRAVNEFFKDGVDNVDNECWFKKIIK